MGKATADERFHKKAKTKRMGMVRRKRKNKSGWWCY
jgi:hypothetical protein